MKPLTRRNERPVRSDRTVAYADPVYAGRHPMQTYMLLACIVSGPLAVLGVATPNTISEALPLWLQHIWTWLLFVGAATALIGGRWPGRNVLNALTAERIGLALIGAAALIYGLVLLATLKSSAVVAAGVIIGFGWACLARARDIGHIIALALHEVREQAAGQ